LSLNVLTLSEVTERGNEQEQRNGQRGGVALELAL